jgi:hypothetical protein
MDISMNESFYQRSTQKPDYWKNFFKSMTKHFLFALGFKIFYKLARNLDKLGVSSISISRLVEIIFSASNFQYATVFLLIRLVYKLFMYYLKNNYDIPMGEKKVTFRLLSLFLGMFISLLVIFIGNNSNVIFYTVLITLLRSLFYFVFYNSERTLVNQNKMLIKHLYYLGVAIGFVNLTYTFKDLGDKIKIIRLFDSKIMYPVTKLIKLVKF